MSRTCRYRSTRPTFGIIGVLTRYDSPFDNYNRAIDNVTSELDAQVALRELDWPEGLTRSLAESVVANLDYAFDIKWRPRWVKAGDPHRWSEPGDEPGTTLYFAERLSCGRIFEDATESAALAAFAAHNTDEHAEG